MQAAEAWFLRHGLPWFVDDIRAQVQTRLTRGRMVNLVVVLVIAQAVQVFLLAVAVFVFFVGARVIYGELRRRVEPG